LEFQLTAGHMRAIASTTSAIPSIRWSVEDGEDAAQDESVSLGLVVADCSTPGCALHITTYPPRFASHCSAIAERRGYASASYVNVVVAS
jgi:hypothetical protein